MKVGVISDDLTGANGTGVRLTREGFTSATMIDYEQPIIKGPYDAVCVDTDSRYMREDTARKRVETVIDNFMAWDADVICKRIDSTVRGNIGIEIDAVLDKLGDKAIAVMVPSFPDSGRVTSGGYLLVDGVPVQQTDVAKDPVSPLIQSFVPAIVQDKTKYPVSHIGLRTILDGEEAIETQIREHIAEGNRILVLDAVTEEEIENIATAMAKIKDYQMIPTDPGPLTSAFAKSYRSQKAKQNKIIVTVGSVTSISKKQLNYLIDKVNATPVYADVEQLTFAAETWEKEVERVVGLALDEMNRQDIVIITTNTPTAKHLDLKALAKEQGVTQDYLAKRITDGLGKITRLLIQNAEHPIGGCFSSGGDVTASLCSFGRAEGIRLEDEVLPLAAYGQFIGGYFDGLPLVTKGGMVGDKRTIYTCVKYLSSKNTFLSNKLIGS